MKTLLLALAILSNQATVTDQFIGVAANEHYIINNNNEGYYIEQSTGIHEGDTVLISNEKVYIIECKH